MRYLKSKTCCFIEKNKNVKIDNQDMLCFLRELINEGYRNFVCCIQSEMDIEFCETLLYWQKHHYYLNILECIITKPIEDTPKFLLSRVESIYKDANSFTFMPFEQNEFSFKKIVCYMVEKSDCIALPWEKDTVFTNFQDINLENKTIKFI